MSQHKTDFSPNGATSLPEIRSVKLRYEILKDQPAVRLSFSGKHSDAITVLGGVLNEPVILNRREVMRLPHNLVQCCMTNIAEGEEVGGLTPDIVYHTETGIEIIEIGTISKDDEIEVHDLVVSKAFKYHRLIEMGVVSKLEVVVVSPSFVSTTLGFITDLNMRIKLTDAYNLGKRIKREYEAVYGSEDPNEDVEKHNRLRSILQNPKLSEFRDGYLDPRCLDEWSVDEEKFRMGTKSYDKDFENWESFVKGHLEGDLDGSKTVVHLPMIIPKKGDSIPCVEVEDAYTMIIANACFPTSSSYRSFEDLENESYFNQGIPKQKTSDKIQADEFRVRLDRKDRMYLSRRGVMKKEFANEEEMREIERAQKRDVSIRISTTDIDYFAEKLEPLVDSGLGNLIEEILGFLCITKETDIKSFELSMLMRSSYFARLYFLDLIAREVAYNMSRNPNDSGDAKMFIVKRILDYDCFVIIRTTRMAGDDSPCHFFVLFKGDYLEGNIFERTYKVGSGWMRSDFVSLSKRKVEHLQGILPQHLALWGMLAEQVGGGLYDLDVPSMRAIINKPFKIMSLILLEDKDNTSQNLQQLRYYYMQLFSGMPESKNISQKIIGKLTPNIRTRLMAYIYQNLIRIHNDIPEDLHKRVFKRGGDIETNSAPSGEQLDYETSILSEALETPFGFMIYGPDEMLLSSYLCMLHNKNEMNFGHGSVKMMEKVCKRQYQRVDFCDRDDDYDVFSVKGPIDPDKLSDFQHSRPAIISAARIIKEKISRHKGWEVKDWNAQAEREILSYMLKATLDEMATTKSSTNPYNSNLNFKKNDEDVTSDFGRRKCIEQMMKLSNDLSDVEVSLNIEAILNGIEIKEEDRIQVSLFKKNQIGGVREIYVLTMRGRLIIRVFCDMLRCLCEFHPSEKLTNDKSKDRFVGEHFSKVKATGLGHVTAKISGDMTNWAQLFSLYDFMDMCSAVLPPIFQPFSYKVLSLHRRKSLQLPDSLVEMFIHNMTSVLSTPSVNRLKKGYLEGGDPLIRKNIPYIHSKTDMMQGILHYPSSFYHLMHLEYLTSIIKGRYQTDDVRIIVSFEVSSDDEGIMVSFCGEEAETRPISWRFYKDWPVLKNSIDKLFGVRTSFEKTTFSMTEMFEFNSKFYIGNSVSSPLVKFVARSCDDNPQESLGRRVSSMYSQLRQLRENGASGDLCSWVSMCQGLSLMMNFGYLTMPWMNMEVIKDIFEFKVTSLGFYGVMPPICAGLVDGTYVNWRASHDPSARRLLYHIAGYGLPNDEDDLESAMYSIYPTKKYHALKSRLGLSGLNRRDLVGDAEFESLMSRSRDKSDSMIKMKYQVLDPTLAASLTWLTRTESMRMTPFIMYASMFKTKEGHKRSIMRLKEALIDLEGNYDQKTLFPMWFQFKLLDHTLSRELISAKLSQKKRLRYQWISPEYSVGEHFKYMKAVLKEIWFLKVQKSLSRAQILHYWSSIKRDVPFMRESLKDTLSASPFSTYAQLLGFIESTSKSPSSYKLLARGVVNKLGQNLESLMRHNISSFAHYSFKDEPELGPVLEMDFRDHMTIPKISSALTQWAQKAEDRVKAWYELVSQSEGDERQAIYDLMMDEFKDIMSKSPRDLINLSSTGSSRLDRFLLNFRLMSGDMGLREYCNESESFRVWIMPDKFEDGEYDQTGSYIQKKDGTTIYALYTPNGYRVSYEGEEYMAREMMKGRITTTIRRGEIPIVDMRSDKMIFYRGGRILRLFSLEAGKFWYMTPPDVTAQAYHMTMSDPSEDIVESWLSRVEPSTEAIIHMSRKFKERSVEGELIRSIAKYAKRITSRGAQLRIAERLDQQEDLKTEEEYFAMMEMDFENFKMDEENPEDFADFYRESEYTDIIAGFTGLEAFAAEQHIIAMELNPCLRELSVIISSSIKHKKLMSKEMIEFVDWFLTLE